MEKGHHLLFCLRIYTQRWPEGENRTHKQWMEKQWGNVDVNDNKKGNSEDNKHFNYCLLPKVDNVRDIKIAELI